MAPTPENPPCWHNLYRCREKYILSQVQPFGSSQNHLHWAMFIKGGGVGQNPPTRLWTPDPPPRLLQFCGEHFFVRTTEAKALSRVMHPSPKRCDTYQKENHQYASHPLMLPYTSSHCLCCSLFRCSLLACSEDPTNTPQPQRDFGMVLAQRQSGRGHQQTARQSSCDQRKKGWQEPNPRNPRGGPGLYTHPPGWRPTHLDPPPPSATWLL